MVWRVCIEGSKSIFTGMSKSCLMNLGGYHCHIKERQPEPCFKALYDKRRFWWCVNAPCIMAETLLIAMRWSRSLISLSMDLGIERCSLFRVKVPLLYNDNAISTYTITCSSTKYLHKTAAPHVPFSPWKMVLGWAMSCCKSRKNCALGMFRNRYSVETSCSKDCNSSRTVFLSLIEFIAKTILFAWNLLNNKLNKSNLYLSTWI